MKEVRLDPRTKILLLLMVSVFIIGGVGGSRMWLCSIVLCLLPLLLLLQQKKLLTAVIYIVLYGFGLLVQKIMPVHSIGIFDFVLLTCSIIFTRLLPGIMMGKYVLSSTKVSEFIAAMERMHITNKITIPLSVLFRFFPTVLEESVAINDAMRMRDVRLGGRKALGVLEYRLVPMITCSVKVGEELSAAALTRGLGAPVKRTNVCKIGFGVWDFLLLLLCFAIIVFWLLGFVKGM